MRAVRGVGGGLGEDSGGVVHHLGISRHRSLKAAGRRFLRQIRRVVDADRRVTAGWKRDVHRSGGRQRGRFRRREGALEQNIND